MNARLLLLAIFTIVATWIASNSAGPLVAWLVFLFGAGAIMVSINTYREINVENGILLLKSFFGDVRIIEPGEIVAWRLHQVHLRHEWRKSLVLWLSEKDRILISLYDDAKHFEELLHLLQTRVPEREDKFSVGHGNW